MNKVLFIIPILLLLAACSSETTQLEELKTETQDTQTAIDIFIEADVPEPYYNLSEGETIKVLGKTITLKRIYQNPQIELVVDGEQTTIKQTKNQEIIDDITIEIILTNTDNLKDNYVVLKIEPLILEDNQYIVEKNKITNIGNKDLILDSSKSDGSITINVYDKGTKIGDEDNLKRGETSTIYGLTITNVHNYYMVNQYAIVEVSS